MAWLRNALRRIFARPIASPSEQFRKTFGPDSGLEGCDFQPNFDGCLWNAFRITLPSETREAHMALVWGYVREIATWILARRHQFQPGDGFQLVIGWPESVRASARQIVKLGGRFDELVRIAEADSFVDYESISKQPVFRRYWDKGIFE
jgi:hypothetical protein